MRETVKIGSLFILVVLASLISGCGTVSFKSYNKSDQAAAQSLMGYITKPEGAGPFPAVVLLPGCSGVEPKESTMADTLVKNGYVALIVDSFTTRSLQSVCENPRKIDAMTRALDAYGALIHLQTLSFVDPARIGLIGWSHGGLPALTAVDNSLQYFYPDEPDRRFKGAVSYYPWCDYTSRANFYTDVLVMIGDSDNWTPAKNCEMMIKDLLPESRPVDLVVYPGVAHAFDNINNLPPKTYQGYSLAYSQSATDDSIRRTLQFLKEHFK